MASPASPAGGDSKRIAAGVRFLTYQNIANTVLGYVFLTLLLRLLSPTQYGLYSSVLLIMAIASSATFYGLQAAATRFVALLSQDGARRSAFVRSVLSLSLPFASAATVALMVFSPNLSLYFTKSTASAWVFAVSGAWLFSSTVSGIFQGLVQGMKEYETLAKILVAANLAMVCFTAVGLLEVKSVFVPVLAWVFNGIVISALSLKVVRRRIREGVSSEESRSTTQILRYSLPLGIAGVLTVATGAGDPLLVGAFLNAAQMGEYYAAIAIVGGLGVILFSPLNTAFFPETSSSLNDPKKLSNGLSLAFRYTMLALVPVSFALAAMSDQIIGLYSGFHSAYYVASSSLQLMSMFFFFVAMQGILTTLLLSAGRTTQVVLIGVVTVSLDVLLSVVLVPLFGIAGATASRILVDLAGVATAVYLTREYLTGVFDFRFMGKVFTSSALIFAVLYTLTLLGPHRPLTIVPYSLIAAGVFAICAKKMRLLSEADKERIRYFLPASIEKYVRRLL